MILYMYEIRYRDNFKTKVYDCARIYLRLKTVKALVETNKEFIKEDIN
jgi:D-alanyl-D-alanine dipeptidase